MNNSRSHLQSFINNSLGIRQEIQRFESVHPSIFAIFDLIELIPDRQIAQQIRDHLVCIEDSFVHSQEWTLSRSVSELRLGIVGSLGSGKSALVHRYLTGSYMQEDSSDGGRYKKEIIIDNQSYLLLIRDEGGPPEMQFAAWVDAIIYVFSLENEASFNAVYNYYIKMSHFRSGSDIPIILVGTQDAICERTPRIIDDSRARKLANDLKKCSYYETCATYGLNVERVFQDACQKIIQHRSVLQCITPTNSRPTTPQGGRLGISSYPGISSPTNNGYLVSNERSMNNVSPSHQFQQQEKMASLFQRHALSASSHHIPIRIESDQHLSQKWGTISHATSQQTLNAIENNNIPKFNPTQHQQITLDNLHSLGIIPSKDFKEKDLLTPSSTPTTSRKTRRRSNLFIPSSKKSEEKLKNSELGSGRAIPIKQGYLYKRSSKSLNKEWKKKYVTLCDDGRLTYHPSLHDYMDDVHGKEIPLQYVTVKVPGQKPRGSKSIIANTISSLKLGQQHTNGLSDSIGTLSLSKENKKGSEKSLLMGFDMLKDSSKPNTQTSGDEGINSMSNSNSSNFLVTDNYPTKSDTQTPNVKKRHRRMKSSGLKNGDNDDSEFYEFFIVSLDNKQWHFEAACLEERDEWVSVIEQEIFKSLQGNETTKSKLQNSLEVISLQSIRENVPGNDFCVDCNAPNPEWASLNLGVLICIECSGIHRNLGSHISKVRSLGLDDWPPSHVSVMLAIGNKLANSIWEGSKMDRVKPTVSSTREEKEKWIRSKYEGKEFILPCYLKPPIGQQLIEAVIRKDMKTIILLLAYATPKDINSTLSMTDLRTSLHLCCAMGNLALSQLLIWHSADINKVDQDNRTCLFYARAAASSKSICLSPSSLETVNALIDLLLNLGCLDSQQPSICGTLPKKLETSGS